MKKKILHIISIIFGLLLMNSGFTKFFNYMQPPDDLPEALIADNMALAEIVWLLPLIATAEILGGLLILFPRTRALGILVVLPVMAGMLLTHIFVAPFGLPMAFIIWAIMLWIIYENRHKYLPLISKEE